MAKPPTQSERIEAAFKLAHEAKKGCEDNGRALDNEARSRRRGDANIRTELGALEQRMAEELRELEQRLTDMIRKSRPL